MHRIMLVDDEPNVLRALERLLSKPQREIECFTDPQQALQRAYTATFDLILSDYRMPRMDGVELLIKLKEMQPDLIRLIISGHNDLDAILSAINKAEIYRFITKPWDNFELEMTVENALMHRDMLVENRRLAEQVRQQQQRLSRQDQAMYALERNHPEIAKVVWADDGSIRLDEVE